MKAHADTPDLLSSPSQSHILGLLLAPIRTYHSIFTALILPNYIPLLSAQTYPTRRAVAREIARMILKKKTQITTVDNLKGITQVMKVLITEGMQQGAGFPGIQSQRRGETDDTLEEQGWLARIVHYVHGPDNDTQLEVRTDMKLFLWVFESCL